MVNVSLWPAVWIPIPALPPRPLACHGSSSLPSQLEVISLGTAPAHLGTQSVVAMTTFEKKGKGPHFYSSFCGVRWVLHRALCRT